MAEMAKECGGFIVDLEKYRSNIRDFPVAEYGSLNHRADDAFSTKIKMEKLKN